MLRTALLVTAFISRSVVAQDSDKKEEDTPTAPPLPDAPNIVFIFIDDMGYADPSCFGNPLMKTPHIDKLAADGIKLTNFYVNSPICSASRVAITTGQYQGRWGIHSYLNSRAKNSARGMKNYLDSAAPTTAKMLKANGYATAHFGKWHMGGGRDVDDAPLPKAYGFDESLVSFEGLGDRVMIRGNGLAEQSRKLGQGEFIDCDKHETTGIYVDRTIDFIRKHKDEKFYVRMFPNDVHDAFIPKEGEAEKWAGVTANPEEQKFFAVLAEMDRQIGRLVDTIDEMGLGEKTLIVFTSDNGPTDWPKYYRKGIDPPGFTGQFFGRKWSLYEGGIRMPFIARWTGSIKAGTTDDTSPMAAIDLSPTFARLTGSTIPEGTTLDGLDQSALLLGTPSGRSKPIFWQYGAPHATLMPGKADHISPSLAVRDGDFKLLINADGSDAQLYNLIEDPRERNNLVKGQPAKAAELWKKIQDWAADIGFETRADAVPTEPYEEPDMLSILINGKPVDGKATKVGVLDKFGTWQFKPGSVIDLPKPNSPNLVGKEFAVTVEIKEATAKKGVLVAQGGSKNGFSVYITESGKSAFAVCRNGKQTIAESRWTMKSFTDVVVEARLLKGGKMELLVDGYDRGAAQIEGLLTAQPGDSLQIGSDLIVPAGDYQAPFGFEGIIKRVQIDTNDPPKSERYE